MTNRLISFDGIWQLFLLLEVLQRATLIQLIISVALDRAVASAYDLASLLLLAGDLPSICLIDLYLLIRVHYFLEVTLSMCLLETGHNNIRQPSINAVLILYLGIFLDWLAVLLVNLNRIRKIMRLINDNLVVILALS